MKEENSKWIRGIDSEFKSYWKSKIYSIRSNKIDLQWKALVKECRNETGSDVAKKAFSRVRVRTRLALQQIRKKDYVLKVNSRKNEFASEFIANSRVNNKVIKVNVNVRVQRR